MKNKSFFTSVLVGLLAGNVFAEGDLPFSVINTLRFGYDDNVYSTSKNQEESAYVQDIIDLSFRAALSDRTDLIFKSRFDFRSDKEMNFHPNIYAVLTHSVSPRLLLQLSDKFTSGNRHTSSKEGRYNYYHNTLEFLPSYVLSPKDSLSAPVSYTIKRHEDEIDNEDTDIISAGLSWKRELSPQRTWAALHFSQLMIDYINRDSTADFTRLSAEISHTFNPQWQGVLAGGVTFDQTDFTVQGTNLNVTSEGVNPYFNAGLTYSPSPQTRFTANVIQQYKESSSASYAGENARTIALGAQHDFTAKIMGKLTASFTETERDQQDNETTSGGTTNEEYYDLALRFQYKINRMNFLELGFRHREKAYDISSRDWDQNMVDVGWRVEL